MLGKSGKSSGAINEATNHLTNQRLNSTIEYMASKEYQKERERDTTDVIPTHARPKAKEKVEDMAIYDPEQEKRDQMFEAQNEEDEDDDLAFLRAQRMQAMKKEQTKLAEWKQKGHGWYREIAQDEFFPTVVREKGGSEHVAVHFFHQSFERCKVLDARLSELAKMMMSTRFVKVDVEKSPFLVEKLKITVLPCIVLFCNDVAVDRILGFEDMGVDDVSVSQLNERIERGLKMILE